MSQNRGVRPMPAVMTTAAQVNLAAVAAFSLLLVIVHVLKPEIDPSWRMISEYEIGRHGWLMRLAFVCWSVSVFAVAVALWPYASILGDVALVVVGVGPIGVCWRFGHDEGVRRGVEGVSEQNERAWVRVGCAVSSQPIRAGVVPCSLPRHCIRVCAESSRRWEWPAPGWARRVWRIW